MIMNQCIQNIAPTRDTLISFSTSDNRTKTQKYILNLPMRSIHTYNDITMFITRATIKWIIKTHILIKLTQSYVMTWSLLRPSMLSILEVLDELADFFMPPPRPFLPLPSSLSSMSRSLSSNFRCSMIWCRMSGWFQIWITCQHLNMIK